MRSQVVIGFVVWFVSLASVAAADVRVDFDRHKDFSRYRTVSVEVGPFVRVDGVVDEKNTLAEERLRRAITDEFQARGIEPTGEQSQLIVRASSRDRERNEIVSSGWGYPGPWGLRRSYWRHSYWGWPYGGDVWTRRYFEEALTLDVIERESGALVYRAYVTREVGNDRDKDTVKAVDQAFKKFPIKEIEQR